jgi:GNAT superfamily N-acetyltransferase
MAAGYRVVAATPSVGDYVRLREEAGLSPKSRAAAERGLAGTWFAACVLDADDAVVGMGRIVGDGGCFFQVVDVAVAPPHQRRGLGRRIMQALVRRRQGATRRRRPRPAGTQVCGAP